jgi:hypothetical protein
VYRLTVVDEFTRESLTIEVARSFTGRDVITVLEEIFAIRIAGTDSRDVILISETVEYRIPRFDYRFNRPCGQAATGRGRCFRRCASEAPRKRGGEPAPLLRTTTAGAFGLPLPRPTTAVAFGLPLNARRPPRCPPRPPATLP